MSKAISTQHAPGAIGPYSQAILANNTLYCSGQIPLDPKTGHMVTGDIKLETERVMENLAAVLAEATFGWAQVVRTTIFLADMNDFAAVNEVYGRYFNDLTPPARATVQVARLPRDARVEIDCIAVREA